MTRIRLSDTRQFASGEIGTDTLEYPPYFMQWIEGKTAAAKRWPDFVSPLAQPEPPTPSTNPTSLRPSRKRKATTPNKSLPTDF